MYASFPDQNRTSPTVGCVSLYPWFSIDECGWYFSTYCSTFKESQQNLTSTFSLRSLRGKWEKVYVKTFTWNESNPVTKDARIEIVSIKDGEETAEKSCCWLKGWKTDKMWRPRPQIVSILSLLLCCVFSNIVAVSSKQQWPFRSERWPCLIKSVIFSSNTQLNGKSPSKYHPQIVFKLISATEFISIYSIIIKIFGWLCCLVLPS